VKSAIIIFGERMSRKLFSVIVKETNTTIPIVDGSANEILVEVCKNLKQKLKYARQLASGGREPEQV